MIKGLLGRSLSILLTGSVTEVSNPSFGESFHFDNESLIVVVWPELLRTRLACLVGLLSGDSFFQLAERQLFKCLLLLLVVSCSIPGVLRYGSWCQHGVQECRIDQLIDLLRDGFVCFVKETTTATR